MRSAVACGDDDKRDFLKYTPIKGVIRIKDITLDASKRKKKATAGVPVDSKLQKLQSIDGRAILLNVGVRRYLERTFISALLILQKPGAFYFKGNNTLFGG